jgi:hypothetical protein
MRSVPIAVDHETPLDAVYEDDDFIAVNKPVGFHTAPIHRWQGGSIVSILLAHFSKATAAAGDAPQQQQGGPVKQQQKQQPEEPIQQQPQQQQVSEKLPSHVAAVKPYVLHRLDYNTSGLLLIGKRREVVPGVAMQFRWDWVLRAWTTSPPSEHDVLQTCRVRRELTLLSSCCLLCEQPTMVKVCAHWSGLVGTAMHVDLSIGLVAACACVATCAAGSAQYARSTWQSLLAFHSCQRSSSSGKMQRSCSSSVAALCLLWMHPLTSTHCMTRPAALLLVASRHSHMWR